MIKGKLQRFRKVVVEVSTTCRGSTTSSTLIFPYISHIPIHPYHPILQMRSGFLCHQLLGTSESSPLWNKGFIRAARERDAHQFLTAKMQQDYSKCQRLSCRLLVTFSKTLQVCWLLVSTTTERASLSYNIYVG